RECHMVYLFFFVKDPATSVIYTLSLHDALPIFHVVTLAARTSTCSMRGGSASSSAARFIRAAAIGPPRCACRPVSLGNASKMPRSEEHTSELQSRRDLVCRLLLEKKKDDLPSVL